MRCAEIARLALIGLLGLLAGCGGGNSTESTLIVAGVPTGTTGIEAVVTEPQGSNTTEIVVDSGPATGFALGAANLPYVTVTVCAPAPSTACVSIDHVFLDTGSIGLRVLRSAVASLGLPAIAAEGGGVVSECYPFVVGAVWGPLARADVRIGGEAASNLPVQLIDDGVPALAEPPADCVRAANGELLKSVTSLQAKGVLGVGMLSYDCGLVCEAGDYSGYTLYYRCDSGGACTATPVRAEQQVQNPVSHFAQNNNGTVIVLPALSEVGASVARGRLVFGIGTQTNNQPLAQGSLLRVETDPASPSYLYISATVGGVNYPYGYIDSGSNGLFFDDATLSTRCAGNGAGGAWYCPASAQKRTVVMADTLGGVAQVDLSVANADVLFASANTAFANLGGAAGAASPGAFVFGLPFFYGRKVYTSIWGQALASNGPWYGF